MINTIIGQKIEQTQKFLEDGTRIPVTVVRVESNPVISVKTMDKNGYNALLVGFGIKKNAKKAELGQIKGVKLEKAPKFLKEVKVEEEDLKEPGEQVTAEEVLKPGDIVDVVGVSKGKGYAGVVKKHHFKGGPRTHGQSDRERAPGSIGQTTTPGRVYRGKKMSGRMGQENVTIKNLEVIDVNGTDILIKGLVPGSVKSTVTVIKRAENKKFTPLFSLKSDIKEENIETPQVDIQSKEEKQENSPTEEQSTGEIPQETPKETQTEVKTHEPKKEEVVEEKVSQEEEKVEDK